MAGVKEAFAVSGCRDLNQVPEGGKVHVIGVCGVAMAQLAVALSELGYQVTGSDKEFYEPMSGLLKKSSVQTQTGFSATNIPANIDLVIIGNAISRSNCEVVAIEERSLPYTIFPKIIGDVLISNRTSIVISGTHGKTTTTSIGAHVLCRANLDPSYFIGGLVKGEPKSLCIGKGAISIVEGDEYDSAFFAKVPKFLFYKPSILVITSLEFDHADIYPDLSAIETVFKDLVHGIPSDGTVLLCVDDPNLERLKHEFVSLTKGKVLTYGFSASADYRIESQNFTDGIQAITVSLKGKIQK